VAETSLRRCDVHGESNIVNRKLIRPNLSELKEKMAPARHFNRRKSPHYQGTNAENYYYVKQIENRTPLVIVLKDDEEIRGTLEWYDRDCLKIKSSTGKGLVVLKHFIKYMFKEKELSADFVS
jgi:host factor-I protein